MITDIKSALRWGRFFLAKNDIESASLDTAVLLAHTLEKGRDFIHREPDFPLTPEQRDLFQKLVHRRAEGEPVAYLLGTREFMGLPFKVDKRVLVPRPETELLVETALALLGGKPPVEGAAVTLPPAPGTGIVVDVGTGSGIIGISIAYFIPGIKVYATDISPAALEVACYNARQFGLTERVNFLAGDLLKPLEPLNIKGGTAVITANLPYIPSGEMSELPRDVREYEPHTALDGGRDGLDFYRQLVQQALEYLVPGGYLLMEITPGQGQLLRETTPPGFFIKIVNDLAGRERLVILRSNKD